MGSSFELRTTAIDASFPSRQPSRHQTSTHTRRGGRLRRLEVLQLRLCLAPVWPRQPHAIGGRVNGVASSTDEGQRPCVRRVNPARSIFRDSAKRRRPVRTRVRTDGRWDSRDNIQPSVTTILEEPDTSCPLDRWGPTRSSGTSASPNPSNVTSRTRTILHTNRERRSPSMHYIRRSGTSLTTFHADSA